MAVLQHHHSRSAGHLFCRPGPRTEPAVRWIRDKLLENKSVEILGWRDHEWAFDVLQADRSAWAAEHGERPDVGGSAEA